MKSNMKCIRCQTPLSGRQKRFCSRRCKNADTNNRHQSYLAQSLRGLHRKKELLEKAGGKCSICGYDRNLAALTWHHLDPALKRFSLDLRSLSNRSAAEIEIEVSKCVVLCANCHAETHFPNLQNTRSKT